MGITIKRLQNSVGRALDHRVISQPKQETIAIDAQGSSTAKLAFQQVLDVIKRTDPQAKLKHLSAPEGTSDNGQANQWMFGFDLPSRRAQAITTWILDGRIKLAIQPFPVIGSNTYKLVRDGKVPYRHLEGLWLQEQTSRPTLPERFRDSDKAITELKRQGFVPEKQPFVLGAGQGVGGLLCWIAQAGEQMWASPLTS